MSVVNNLLKLISRGRKGENVGLSTGIPRLDKLVYGIQRRCITTIGGDTGSGKSTLALYIYVYRPLSEMIANGEDVQILYFSFEMSAEVLFAKLLSLYIFDKFNRILSYEDILSLTSALSDSDWKLVEKSKEWLETIEDRITIVDKSLGPEQVQDVLRQWHEAFGEFVIDQETGNEAYIPNNIKQYRIAIIDHMGLLAGPLKQSIDATTAHVMWFRNICSLTGVFVQQLNRNFKDMARKKSVYNMVQLNDFADSSGPAQGSEIVIALYDAYREKDWHCLKYNVEVLQDRYRALLVLKNRYGKSNKSVSVNFFGEIGFWRELPKPENINSYENYTVLRKNPLDLPIQKDEPRQTDSKMNVRLMVD